MLKIEDALQRYSPYNAQEASDRTEILSFLSKNKDAFLRSHLAGHMTASAWVVNQKRDKVLMVYHKIYNSWSWIGGHADGCEDLLSVAIRECREESGVSRVWPLSPDIFSLEILAVNGHEKNGAYLPSHLHYNVTYLLEADEKETLKICEAENTGVRWFSPEEALSASSEPWFRERIYPKLIKKMTTLEGR